MLNQAYFMGLLFLLSGYFTRGPYERKGPGKFLTDRLLRLGAPTLVYVLIISPLEKWGSQLPAEDRHSIRHTHARIPVAWVSGPIPELFSDRNAYFQAGLVPVDPRFARTALLIVSVTAFIAFIIGLFDPGRAIFWSQNKTKTKLIVYLIIFVIFGAIWLLKGGGF